MGPKLTSTRPPAHLSESLKLISRREHEQGGIFQLFERLLCGIEVA